MPMRSTIGACRSRCCQPIAHALAVSVEALIGQKEATPVKRGPAPKLLQQMERIQRLPKAQQRFVMQVIDTVLAQQDR